MNTAALHTPLAQQRVGGLVRERPLRGRVFDSLGIDYCCGGNRTLAAACAAADVPLVTAIGLLGQSDSEASEAVECDWSTAYLAALVDHIIEKHHAYLQDELPRLASLIRRVVAAHAGRHPELIELSQVFSALASELTAHMLKEEHVLFPAIKRLEQHRGEPCTLVSPGGGLDQPIAVMEDEHRSVGQALRRIHWLTADYHVPPDACNAYRSMLAGLERLETDLHLHIHKENNILFPRACRLSAEPAPSQT